MMAKPAEEAAKALNSTMQAIRDRLPLRRMYDLLDAYFGDLQWWPAASPFEVMVGAILTQNTAWLNVEKALANLRHHNLLTPERLLAVPSEELERHLRPSGYYRVKTRRLRSFLFFLDRRFQNNLAEMFSLETGELRRLLLQVNGIGEETADSILLYAAARPVFVVDAYTRRIFLRHGIIAGNITCGEIQLRVSRELIPETRLYNQFHALLVSAGKNFCAKRPRCGICPLSGLALLSPPESGYPR